jgi:Nuclear protein 96
LLKLFADDSLHDLSPLFGPQGIGGSLQDLSSSFHITAILYASKDRWSLSDDTLDTIVEGYVTELIGDGLWHWAVFITLYVFDGVSGADIKIERAKNLVLRFYESHQSDRRTFLEAQIGIPAVWFDEALCHRAMQQGDLTGVVHHMISFARIEAIRLYDHGLLPEFFFESETGHEDICKMDDIANISTSLLAAVRRFLDFDNAMQKFRANPKVWTQEDIGALRDMYTGLVETFHHHPGTSSAIPLVYHKTTELTGHMVVAAIRERLDQHLSKDMKAMMGEDRVLY